MNRSTRRVLLYSLVIALMLFASAGYAYLTQPATAGPSSSGTQYRAAAIENGSVVRSVPLLEKTTYTSTGANTPVASSPVCFQGDPDLFAARLTLTGTLAGTNPTLTIVLQSSDDGGTTWTNVGSAFAAINATVTPTGGLERVTFADSESGGINTPVAFGNCFRTVRTFTGTGSPAGNVGVSLYAE